MHIFLIAMLLLLTAPLQAEENTSSDDALAIAVAQLRDSIGQWQVVTEFLNEDGSIARSVAGSYEFAWVLEDRIASGVSSLPALDMTSAILFYVNEADKKIEMVSVGRDGKLWIMNGPLDGETRHSQEFDTADGGKAQLRFTRYNVAPARFESRMEYTTDGGETWLPGNHQVFSRRAIPEQ
ncbi:MAG: hypothetical protein WBM54_00810 [Woeseia sp.]